MVVSTHSTPPDRYLPQHALAAASFAESLACEYLGKGVRQSDLFAAFVGLVSAVDQRLAADCLSALEAALLKRENR